MKDIRAVFSALRKNGKGQYKLLSGCLFFGSLLITAFCMMMYSPTVQNTLPQGGDSRKQVMMIFILAVIGCAAFSVYAAGLFFRYKSRETGVFLALGLSRKTLGQQLRREVIQLAVASCGAGLILGTPLCWLIWSLFRLSLVDTPEMALIFDLRAYLIPLAFLLFVLIMLLVMQKRFPCAGQCAGHHSGKSPRGTGSCGSPMVRLGRYPDDCNRLPAGIFCPKLLCKGAALVRTSYFHRTVLSASSDRTLLGAALYRCGWLASG